MGLGLEAGEKYWVPVKNIHLCMQWCKRIKTVEVARKQCKEMIVGSYVTMFYKGDQGYNLKDDFKTVLREDLSSLNFSLGDVAHSALHVC